VTKIFLIFAWAHIDEGQNGDRGRHLLLNGGRHGICGRRDRVGHSSEIPQELVRRPIASIGVLFERLVDDDLERSRQRRVKREQGRLAPVQEMIEHRRNGIALKRRSAGRHFETDHSECKQVRARV
jgi:hypothetical protein